MLSNCNCRTDCLITEIPCVLFKRYYQSLWAQINFLNAAPGLIKPIKSWLWNCFQIAKSALKLKSTFCSHLSVCIFLCTLLCAPESVCTFLCDFFMCIFLCVLSAKNFVCLPFCVHLSVWPLLCKSFRSKEKHLLNQTLAVIECPLFGYFQIRTKICFQWS